MIKEWCARAAAWNSKRHLRLAELWADIDEWLSTHFRWESIRARRDRRNEIFDDPDTYRSP